MTHWRWPPIAQECLLSTATQDIEAYRALGEFSEPRHLGGGCCSKPGTTDFSKGLKEARVGPELLMPMCEAPPLSLKPKKRTRGRISSHPPLM